MDITIITNSKKETIALGKKFAASLSSKDIIALTGDLGAGKTTFVSGVAKGLKIKEDIISPTFNILKCYFDSKIPLFHIDAYRLENANKDIGLEEYIEGDGICFIEWPMFIKEYLNIPHLQIQINNKGNNKREFVFKAPNKKYENKIKDLL